MRRLALQESPRVEVDPRALYYPSGIEIEAGARYRFQAEGRWKDSWIECGPEGWHGLLLTAGNRLPWKPFFLLCGTLGWDLEHAFGIGPSLPDWPAPADVDALADRQLYFFANDWPGRYGNNHPLAESEGGPLRVTITRIT